MIKLKIVGGDLKICRREKNIESIPRLYDPLPDNLQTILDPTVLKEIHGHIEEIYRISGMGKKEWKKDRIIKAIQELIKEVEK